MHIGNRTGGPGKYANGNGHGDEEDAEVATALRGYAELLAENRRLEADRTAVLSKLTATQHRLAEMEMGSTASSSHNGNGKHYNGHSGNGNGNGNCRSGGGADDTSERYSYLLLLLSKLKIENVALRSRLDAEAVGTVVDCVAEQLGRL